MKQLDSQKARLKSLWQRLEIVREKYPESDYLARLRNEIYNCQDRIAEMIIENKLDIKFDYGYKRK